MKCYLSRLNFIYYMVNSTNISAPHYNRSAIWFIALSLSLRSNMILSILFLSLQALTNVLLLPSILTIFLPTF